MQEFYRAVRELDMDCRNMAVTVIEGPFLGSKFLLSDGNVVWKSVCMPQTVKKTDTSERTDASEKTDTSERADVSERMDASEKTDIAERTKTAKKTDTDGRILGELSAQASKLPDCGIYAAGFGTVFCEVLGRDKKIVICGGGHVSIPVIQIGRMLGFHVTVLEDRPKFADHARQAGASQVFCESFAEGLGKIQGDGDTYFVIVTRGHRYDQECLLEIAKKKHAYIGMIGSRRRAAAVKETVVEAGADPAVIGKVYTPIGIAIGAKTPEEIAVAIMAQIIQVKNQRPGSSFPAEILEAVLDEEHVGEAKVLATIIQRKGSAPREAGAKMLVMADGRCVGTIGGGCAESEIQKRALMLLREGNKTVELCRADLSAEAAQEEGMICGGVIEVMLELV